ncbi:MAG TPA: Ger(x)C family spore germination protein [Limnochordia bacterium]
MRGWGRWGRRLVAAAVLLLVAGGAAGCWDRREIEERSAILSIALDRQTPASPLRLGVRIAVPGGIPLGGAATQGGTRGPAATPLVTTGETTMEALSNLRGRLSLAPFFGHTRIIAVSERLARQGLEDVLNTFSRHNQIRRLLWLVVVRDNALRILEFQPAVERVPTLFLLDMLDDLRRQGQLPNAFFGRFLIQEANLGEDPAIPYLEVANAHDVRYQGVAVFNGDRMVGWIDRHETGILLQLLGGGRAGGQLEAKVPGGFVGVELTGRRAATHPEMRNGQLSMHVSVRLEGNVREVIGDIDVSTSEKLHLVARALEDELTREAYALIHKMQSWQSDVFGFGEHVRAHLPDQWDPARWKEQFKTLPVEVDVKVSIRRVGMLVR